MWGSGRVPTPPSGSSQISKAEFSSAGTHEIAGNTRIHFAPRMSSFSLKSASEMCGILKVTILGVLHKSLKTDF